jgi:acetyltransferase-like isoleucine patch superfamily enzyme
MRKMAARLMRELLENVSLRANWVRVCRNLSSNTMVQWHASYVGENIIIGDSTLVEDFAHIQTGVLPSEHVYIGNDCRIRRGAQIYSWEGYVETGDNCSLNANSVIYGTGGVKIGNGVRIAANTVIVALMHHFE